MKKLSIWLLTALAALAFVGCSADKGPAEKALGSAEAAYSAVHDQAMKYVPQQLGGVEDQLQQVKDSYAKGDYKAVVAAAPALAAAISGLKDAATAKQTEIEAALAKAKDDWGPASTDVPKMVDAIQSRVDILSKSHHLPKGVTKDSLAAAKTGLDAMKASWGEATTAAGSGDFTTAMSKAQAVKDQATKIMQSLGMTSS
jgi:hypothetical protein